MNIVFVSHSAFDASMVVGSHQLSRVYAKAGHRVLHLSLPFSLFHVARLHRPRMMTRLKSAWQGPSLRSPNLIEWVPLSLVPWDAARLLLKSTAINLTVPAAGRITKVVRKFNLDPIDVALIDDPRMVGIQSVLNAKKTVYRATDLYAELRSDPWIIEAERQLIGQVDGVFSTSPRVAEHLSELGDGCQVDVFPNGFDAEHFQQARPPDSSLSGISRPRVVYVGAIDDRFDVQAVVDLASSRPGLEVLVYGPITESIPHTIPTNLQFKGPLEYASLPAVLQHCEIAMLPLRDIPSNHGRSPMKYYEYVAAGAKIVAFAGESLKRLAGEPGLFLYDEANGKALAAAVDKALVTEVHATPAENQSQSWTNIGNRILERVAGL